MILRSIAKRLKSLFRPNLSSKSDRVAEVSARLEQKVLNFVENMPALPDTASRAMVLAEDPESTINEFARLIEGDATLATALLRTANSALFAGGSQTLNLQQAVGRLGMWRCKDLIISISMRSALRGMRRDTQIQCETLWNHGFITASLCSQLNSSARLGFRGQEISAGLLHDLGRLLIVLADCDCAEISGVLDFHEGNDQLAREQAAIGIDHCELGAWFGLHSKLPDELIQTIRLHHIQDSSGSSNGLVALVSCADHIANYLQCGDTLESYKLQENRGFQLLSKNWHAGKGERLSSEVPSMMEVAIQSAREQGPM